jgi:tRNA (Thr-GGU) A37 N-methylase
MEVSEMPLPLKPIGVVHVKASDEEVRTSLTGVEGVLEIYEEYAEGLYGIEGFSHLIVVALLHKVPEERKEDTKGQA